MQVEILLVFVATEITLINTITGKLIEGDILNDEGDYTAAETMSRSQTTVGVFETVQTWPDGIVPYFIDDSIPLGTELYRNVSLAFKNVEQSTGYCVKFPYTTSTDTSAHVRVTSMDTGCYAALGRRGGQQIINIGSTCGSVGVIMHEILHALGLWHEHSRSDRDEYIEIKEENIIPGKEVNFEIHPGRKDMEDAVRYDLRSILHYKYNQFSMDENADTIVPLHNTGVPKEALGQRERITDRDVEKIIWLYNCPSCLSPDSDNMLIKPERPFYKNRQVATFQCKQSYRRIGAATSYCTVQDSVRKWTGAVPICIDNNLVNSRYINKLLFADFEDDVPRYSYWVHGTRQASFDTRRQLNIPSLTDHTSEWSDQGHFFSFNNNEGNALYTTPYLQRNMNEKVSFIFFYSMYNFGESILSVTIHWFSFNWSRGSHVLWDRHGPTVDAIWYCKHVHDITELINKEIRFYRIQFDVSKTTNIESFTAIDDVLIGPTEDVDRFLELQQCQTESSKNTEHDSIERQSDSGKNDT